MNPGRFDRALALFVLAFAVVSAQAQGPLKTITIRVGPHPLKVEVADNPHAHTRGLMFRDKLGAEDGMLFVYDDPGYHSMWMKNTRIPLSVAFLDGTGKILNILDMQPHSEDFHMSAGPASYSIETNKGWFEAKKIKAGDKVTGLPKVTR